MKMTDAENHLMGALIGLANAVRGNEDIATEATRKLVREALVLTGDDEALSRMTQEIQSEKWRIVPDCAVCQFPCGRNADYDMELMWTEEADILEWKLKILRMLTEAARGSETIGKKAFEEFFCEALRTLGDIWDVQMLKEQTVRLEQNRRCANC